MEPSLSPWALNTGPSTDRVDKFNREAESTDLRFRLRVTENEVCGVALVGGVESRTCRVGAVDQRLAISRECNQIAFSSGIAGGLIEISRITTDAHEPLAVGVGAESFGGIAADLAQATFSNLAIESID